MKLTERDLEMMRFINDCGFCITPQLEKKFLIRNWRVYQLMKRLVGEGHVVQRRLFYGKPNVYFLSERGAQFSDLPAISRVNLGGFQHQMILNDVMIRLCQLYPNAIWTSERKLKHDHYFLGLGVRGHVADSVLTFDTHKVAIEVELTLKSKFRLDTILRMYSGQLALKEVWYFCSEEVLPTLSKMVVKKNFIKLFPLKEFLNG